MLFAFATASSGVRNVSTDSTGPKISSRATRIVCSTPENTVGGKNKLRSGSGQELVQRFTPSASPAAARSTIRSSCGRELMAPTFHTVAEIERLWGRAHQGLRGGAVRVAQGLLRRVLAGHAQAAVRPDPPTPTRTGCGGRPR